MLDSNNYDRQVDNVSLLLANHAHRVFPCRLSRSALEKLTVELELTHQL